MKMNNIAIEKTTNRLQKYFGSVRIVTIWLFAVSLILWVIDHFRTANLAAVVCLGIFSFLAIAKGKGKEISDLFVSVLIVADSTYIIAIMFMLGRLLMVM
jgi:hypothetical protein